MTKAELDKKISDISNESVSTEEKQRRIKILNDTYSNNQTRMADEARAKRQDAEATLKSRLQKAYMVNPAATDKDFERDYPQLKSDYLRSEAMKQEAVARESAANAMRGNF